MKYLIESMILLIFHQLKTFFLFLKEPRVEKDDDNCKKINEFLNNPPGPGGVGGGSGGTGSSGGPDQDLQSLLNNMSQTQLLQLFGGVGQGLSNLLGTMKYVYLN